MLKTPKTTSDNWKKKRDSSFYSFYGVSAPDFCFCIQAKAREAGLWNLFLPAVSGLSQLDYAYIAEETGRCLFAPDVFNCQAPGETYLT